jgi:hypothetical protein
MRRNIWHDTPTLLQTWSEENFKPRRTNPQPCRHQIDAGKLNDAPNSSTEKEQRATKADSQKPEHPTRTKGKTHSEPMQQAKQKLLETRHTSHTL